MESNCAGGSPCHMRVAVAEPTCTISIPGYCSSSALAMRHRAASPQTAPSKWRASTRMRKAPCSGGTGVSMGYSFFGCLVGLDLAGGAGVVVGAALPPQGKRHLHAGADGGREVGQVEELLSPGPR